MAMGSFEANSTVRESEVISSLGHRTLLTVMAILSDRIDTLLLSDDRGVCHAT